MGTYGWGDSSVTTAIVEAVATESECDPEELEPLYEVVDPDALEAFFDAGSRGSGSPRRVAFTYEGYEVTVSGADRIEVTRTETPLVG